MKSKTSLFNLFPLRASVSLNLLILPTFAYLLLEKSLTLTKINWQNWKKFHYIGFAFAQYVVLNGISCKNQFQSQSFTGKQIIYPSCRRSVQLNYIPTAWSERIATHAYFENHGFYEKTFFTNVAGARESNEASDGYRLAI